jgi:hypothetical protein
VLDESLFKLPELSVKEVACLVDEADENVGHGLGRAGFKIGPIGLIGPIGPGFQSLGKYFFSS